MSIRKIALGTVQFGLPYGIQKNGQVSEAEAHRILARASLAGIKFLDTAEAYGNSEEVLGHYLKKHPGQFSIMSKFMGAQDSLREKLIKTLDQLSVESLEGYYYHRFHEFEAGVNWKELLSLKLEGLIKKIGVSLYSIEELKKAISVSEVDIIQLPFNLLDRADEKRKLLEQAHRAGKTVVIRSVFLQGLFFMKKEQVNPKLHLLTDKISELGNLAARENVSLASLALNYALSKSYIDQVLIGVDSLVHLEENLQLVRQDLISSSLASEIEDVLVENQELLNPGNW